MRRTSTPRLLGCACLVTLTGAQAAHAQAFKSGVDMVALTVTVTDRGGQGINGLTADNFAVYEDGVRQDVQLFGSDQVPLDVALVLDTSNSMLAALPRVKNGARRLLARLREGDRAMVLDVNSRIQIPETLTAHRARAEAAVDALRAGGETAIYDGLYVALQQFARDRRLRPELRRQAIVIFSDGLDTASHLQFDDLAALARSLDVAIYTITLHDGRLPEMISQLDDVRQAMWEMRTLTRDTGGLSFFPGKAAELERVYDTIAAELVNQYALAYRVPEAGETRKFRHVSIRLIPPAQGVARTRSGYLARPASMQMNGRYGY